MQPRLLFLFALSIPASLAAQRTASEFTSIRGSIPTATATALATDAVQVAWTPFPNATEYRVFRGVDPNGPFAPVGRFQGGVTSLRDAGLVPGTLFHYRIEAMASNLTLTRSGTGQVAPLGVLTASAVTWQVPAPTGLRRCTPVTGGCLITWQAVPGAVAYAIYEQYFSPQYLRCAYGNSRWIYGTEAGSTGKGVCSESYQVAAVFVMKDFPTAGASFYGESQRATITP